MAPDAVVLVACEAQSSGARIRSALLRQGVSCPHSQVVSYELAPSYAMELDPAVIFVVMAPQRADAIEAIRRLRSSTSVKIVAIGVASSPKDVLDVIHTGANDYLDESENFDAELKALLERLKADPTRNVKTGRMIAVASAVGGCGASFTAVNLATEIARQHGHCGLFDFRHPRGDLHSLLNLKPQFSLGDLCRSAAEVDHAMLRQAITEHGSGIHLLASDLAFDSPLHHSEALSQIADLGNSTFSHVIIDMGLFADPAAPAIIRRSELVIILMRLDVVAVIKTRRLIEYLIEQGVGPDHIALVANRCGQPGELALKPAERAVGRRLSHCLPDEPKTVNGSINVGNPVVLEAPAARISKAIKRMCDELVTSFKEGEPGAATLTHAMIAD